MHAADAGDDTRCRRTPVLFVHAMSCPDSKLEKRLSWVAERVDPFASRHLSLGSLLLLSSQASSELELSLLVLDGFYCAPPMLETILEPLIAHELALDDCHDSILQYERFIIRPAAGRTPDRHFSSATIPLMRIRLLAFATARQALGSGEIDFEIEPGATVSDLANQLQDAYPELRGIWPRLAIAVDGDLAGPQTVLEENSEVALLPPVSGGAPRGRAQLVDHPIDLQILADAASHPSCGAVLMFVGNVRDRHQDRDVDRITYDAYRTMALDRLEAIAADLEDPDSGVRVHIVHRLGEIPVGEASVAIAVASPHRAAAYETSRTALERLKQEVPIWKQEHYTDGRVEWREEENLV